MSISRSATGLAARRVTQADVARVAGVSAAVVSAVTSPNGKSGIRVGQDTAKRVQEAVRQLGYAPNPVAQSLAGGRRHILGVFTYEPVFPHDLGDFFHPMLRGIEIEVAERGFDLLLFTSMHGHGRSRRIFGSGANRMGVADGAILLGQEPDVAELERLAAERFPFVTIGRREAGDAPISYVAVDYAAGTDRIVRHCHDLGHRRIALLGLPVVREQQIDRERGYTEAVIDLDLPWDDRLRTRLGPDAVDESWLDALLQDGATALLAETQKQAEAVDRLLARRGRAVPDDLSIAVLGNPMEASADVARWTRFRIPREEMGRESVRLLLRLLDRTDDAPARTTLPCMFEVGATTGPVTARP